MKQATKRFLSMILSLFFLVGSFVVFFQFIEPLYGDVQQVRSEMESRQNFLANQKDAIQKVQKLIATYQGQGQLQQQVSMVIPTSTDTIGALAQLNGLAESTGLGLDSVSVSSPILMTQPTATGTAASSSGALTKPVGMENIEIKMNSSYAGFKNFLTKLETNMRIFDVRTLNIAPSGKPGTYVFDITVTTYFQSQ